MGFWSQYVLLLWKNFKIQLRSPIWTIFEFVPPIGVIVLMAYLRGLSPDKPHAGSIPGFTGVPVYGGISDAPCYTDSFNGTTQTFCVGVCSLKPFPYTSLAEGQQAISNLFYTPDNEETRKIMNILHQRFPNRAYDEYVHNTDNNYQMGYAYLNFQFQGFDNETEMMNEIDTLFDEARQYCQWRTDHTNSFEDGLVTDCFVPVLGAIIFPDNFDSTNGPVDYTLRWPSVESGNCYAGGVWNTDKIQNPYGALQSGQSLAKFRFDHHSDNTTTLESGTIAYTATMYYQTGFMSVQRAIDLAVVSLRTNKTIDELTQHQPVLSFAPMPTPEYLDVGSIGALFQDYLPFMMVVSFAVTAVYTSRTVCQEKEHRLTEYMKVMGLHDLTYWLSHFTTAFVKVALLMAIYVLVMKYLRFNDYGGHIIEYSNPFIVFLMLLLYGCGVVCFSFACSTFVKSGTIAAAITGVVFFLLFIPYIASPNYDQLSNGDKIAMCFCLNSCMGFSLYWLSELELQGIGVNWDTMTMPITDGDIINGVFIFGMLFANILLYVFIIFYVSQVNPGGDTPSQPPYFLFLPSYWKSVFACFSKSDDYAVYAAPIGAGHQKLKSLDSGFEIAFENKAFVEIDKLCKIFGSGKSEFKAVDHLSFSMLEKQVTALLGHNGAGKTTTVHMLTGMLSMTSGDASIGNYRLSQDLPKIRKIMGLCPQYNVLFDKMTCLEHLYFFCKLKGAEYDEKEAYRLLCAMNLQNKDRSKTGTLSGGQKRKISVGIALIGQSQLVILDEPTSGIDAQARHDIWTLIQNEKRDRQCILLTTHYMEEADVLADRIAIMAYGKLQCCGSPLFLKNKYGAGYRLTVMFASVEKRRQKSELLGEIINATIPGSELHTTAGPECAYLLPTSQKALFPDLMARIESKSEEFSILTLGVSITTMEEVFLKVGEIAEKSMKGQDETDELEIDPETFSVPNPKTGLALWFLQLWAMIDKRLAYMKEIYVSMIVFILIPAILMIISLAIGNQFIFTYKTNTTPMLLKIDKNQYGTSYYPWSATSKYYDEATSFMQYVEQENATTGFSPRYYSTASATPGKETVKHFAKQILKDMNELRPEMKNNNEAIMNIFELGIIFYDYEPAKALPPVIVSHLPPDLQNFTYPGITSLYDSQMFHTPAIGLNQIDEIYGKMQTGDDNFTIMTTNQPLPLRTVGTETFINVYNDLSSWFMPYIAAFNEGVGLSVFISWIPIYLARERITRMKQLQFSAGVNPLAYWMGHLIIDFGLYFSMVACLFAVYGGFTIQALWVPEVVGAHLLLHFMYALAVLPAVYMFTFIVKSSTKVFFNILILGIFAGCVVFMIDWLVSVVMDSIWVSEKVNIPYTNSTQQTVTKLTNFYLPFQITFMVVSPTFNQMRAFSNLYTIGQGIVYCPTIECTISFYQSAPFTAIQCCTLVPATADTLQNNQINNLTAANRDFNIYAWETGWGAGISRELTALGCQAILYLTLLFLIDFDVLRPLRYQLTKLFCSGAKAEESRILDESVYGPLDDDVVKEASEIDKLALDSRREDCLVIAQHLQKNYGKFRAVVDVSFRVGAGQCFGLLGVNGAGKTSTFQMLTGENLITSGDASIRGTVISNLGWRQATKFVGYCGQFDAVVDQFHCYHLLKLLGRIRGLAGAELEECVESVAKATTITKFMDRRTCNLSGGTKRRLSLAMALIGRPKVLMLDEPTTGVDPAARRALWDILLALKEKDNIGIILTSHSMEECEALCDYIGIMVAGRQRCFGSTQHLKSKWSQGYALQIKLHSTGTAQNVEAAVFAKFPGSILKESHERTLMFHLPPGGVWSKLFSDIESLATNPLLEIDDYSLTQSSLEQVFLSFANMHHDSLHMVVKL